MRKFLLLVVLLFSTNLFAQRSDYSLFEYNLTKTINPSTEISNLVDDAIFLDLKQDEYSEIFNNKNYKLDLYLQVTENRKVRVNLERFDILKPGTLIIEKNCSGEISHDATNLVLSYKGYIEGMENSFVVISFYNNTVSGLLKSNNDTYSLGELNDRNGRPTGNFIIYQDSKIKFDRDFSCGSDAFDVPGEIHQRMNTLKYELNDNSFSTLLDANIAIDVDHFSYNVYQQSVANASAYALALMSATSAIYMKDMNIRLIVGYLRVWATPDPYTSSDGSTLLNQFRAEWINTQSGVQRVVAHLVSRRNNLNVAGIAYVNVLCNTQFGYGLSATLSGNIPQLPLYSYDVVVIAHELGHNFGSPHTHNCSWPGGPIDTCYQIEGGCYSGQTFPTAGTIMSYCDIVSGGTVIMDFGPLPEQLIRGVAENSFCITQSQSMLVLAYPNGGETFGTNSVAKIFWGTSLTGNLNIEYSINAGANWLTVQNNVSAQLREYNWNVPYIGSTNQARIRIYDPSNPTFGDTSNANFKIRLVFNSFSVISPANNASVEVSPNDSSTIDFIWGKAADVPDITYKWGIRKINPGSPEFFFSSNSSGADTIKSVPRGILDSLAALMGTLQEDSVRVIWRAYAYSGPDSASSANASLLTLRRTTVSISPISSIIPERFNLENNYPNPFNPTTKIRFDIAKFDKVNITIFDMLGRKLEVLVNEHIQPGKYEVEFSALNLSSGIYYYRMETSEYVNTKKMLLMK